MNTAVILGNLTKEVEVKQTQNGKNYTRFTVAVRRDKDNTDFISCVAWNKTAEFMQKYCIKGMKVCVEGRIETGSYEDKDGKKVYTTDIVVENIEPIWSKKDSEQKVTDDDSSELPF